jgi:uncharacterized cupin superfamily protein
MYAAQILTAPLSATADVSSASPRQSVWEWGDGQVEVGIWECADGTLEGPGTDFDEAMLMVAGRATVEHDGGTVDLVPGTLWATPRHWSSRWLVHQTIRKLYVIDHRPGGEAPLAVPANAYTAAVGAPTPRANPIVGEPTEASCVVWAHNGLEVGVWEATAGRFPASRDGYDEVFVGLAGRATLTSSDGVRFDLTEGSVLYTPSGFTGTWDVDGSFRKAYVIVRNRLKP